MAMKIHLLIVYFWSLLAILLMIKVCVIPTEAFEVNEYDGTCTESAHNYCGTDDNKSIQVRSTYDVIVSFGTTIYNSVLKFISSFKTIEQVLDSPSIIVWKFWVTILETIEKYFPHILSLLFLILAAIINALMWYIRVPLLHILQLDAMLLLVYSYIGPRLVLEYFPWLLSASYNVLFVLIIEYPFYTAVAFLLLSFHKFWIWIPRAMMNTWMTEKIMWVTEMLPVPSPVIKKLFYTRSRTEQLLLDMQEEQHTLMENQNKILKHLQILEQKVQASLQTNNDVN